MSRFQIEPLNTAIALGTVTPTDVRIWLRSEDPVSLEITNIGGNGNRQVVEVDPSQADASDFTMSFNVSDLGVRLCSSSRYRYVATTRGKEHPFAEGQFETAPKCESETPERFGIAIASCHEPFNEEGEVEEQAEQMLQR